MPPRSNRTRAARARTIAVAVTGAIVLVPATANAATVGVVNPSDPQIQVNALPGETNAITVAPAGTNVYLFSEAGPATLTTTDPSCVQETSAVRCTVAGLNSVRAVLGDGNDTLDASTMNNNVAVYGEAGNDLVVGPASQAYGFSILDGGDGDDVLRPGRGIGDDVRGGLGNDTADYSQRTVGVTLDNDGGYSSGEGSVGEYDRIYSDVEELIGGSGDDTLRGGDGSDTLRGSGGNDRLDSGLGADVVDGGSGADRLDGGSGSDDLRGSSGNDDIVARDSGAADTVDCGEDTDSVLADRADTLAGCETADVPALPDPVLIDRAVPVDREVVVEKERLVEVPTQIAPGAPSVVTIVQREFVFAPTKDVVSVKLSCGAENKTGCVGTVSITAKVASVSKLRKARSAAAKKPAATVVLAGGAFKLKGGETRSVTAKISRRGVKQAFGGSNQADAKAKRRIKATMSVVTKGSDGSVTRITKPVSITVPGVLR